MLALDAQDVDSTGNQTASPLAACLFNMGITTPNPAGHLGDKECLGAPGQNSM
jgi:hypothetical protein